MTTTTPLNTPWGTVRVHADGPVTARSDGSILVSGSQVGIDHPFGTTAFYRNGWSSWSPTGWRNMSDEPLRIYDNPERLLTADDAARDFPNQHVGSLVGALQLPEGNVILLGALSLGAPIVGADAKELWGNSDDADSEWFIAYGNEKEMFDRYASLVRDRWGHRRSAAGNLWSSWYSFFEDIDERRLGEVVDDLRGYPFDVVQIDDGWEATVGDWTAGPRFPSGLPALASRITQAGFRAGLWVAPLICLPESITAQEHPEWLVTDRDGSPLIAGYNWGSHYYALDTTLPAVQQHLRDLFNELTSAGFTYFKLDFMYAGALPGVRSTDAHRERVYRDAIELIRQTVGDDVYLLGSGVPMLASVGILDGARVGPDVAPYWDNTERKRDPSGPGAYNSLANSAARIWMRAWYEIDPDVVFFRTRRSLLDDRAMQLLVDVATICDFKAVSDPPAWLDLAERERLRGFLENRADVSYLGRYRYLIDDRVVDFNDYLAGTRDDLESMLVK